jgi:Restriction endonuclease
MQFDHLSDGEFEEFTYDLLLALEFVNLSWRRGTGKGGASADQGRDVVAQLHRQDVDGAEQLETWFVQCKHYQRGVPPESLQSGITWASAERPAVLLFVASNFLSNPAKNWLEDYERNNRPSFRIKLWERKELERLVLSHVVIAVKYHLDLGYDVQNVHPVHLRYLLQPILNSLEFFFEALDAIDASIRDDAFGNTYYSVINPRFRKPVTGDETMRELLIDPVDYGAFKQKCYKLAQAGLAEHFLVQAAVGQTLAFAWKFADASQIPAVLSRNRDAIAYFSERIQLQTDEKAIARLRKMISTSEEVISSAPERQRQAAARYRVLCEQFLPRLELEKSIRWGSSPPSDEE